MAKVLTQWNQTPKSITQARAEAQERLVCGFDIDCEKNHAGARQDHRSGAPAPHTHSYVLLAFPEFDGIEEGDACEVWYQLWQTKDKGNYFVRALYTSQKRLWAAWASICKS